MSIFKGLGWLFRSLWRLLNFTRLMLVNLLFLIESSKQLIDRAIDMQPLSAH